MTDAGRNELGRRDLLKRAAVASFSGVVSSLSVGRAQAQQSTKAHQGMAKSRVIPRENAMAGALDWQLTRVRLDKQRGFRSPWIEGYCSRQSVAAGESIDIMVSTKPAERFMIEIFRTGYYGGRGARLMTTMLHELERTGGRYGMQLMCCGGGLGTATIIERLD